MVALKYMEIRLPRRIIEDISLTIICTFELAGNSGNTPFEIV
jgi:hypothetical protein